MKPIAISQATVTSCGAGNRVTTIIDDQPVWYECDTRPLSGVGEVFGSALFVPGLQAGRPLTLADPVSPLWLGNLPHITALLGGWWGYRHQPPRAVARATDLDPLGQGTMLCFSAGVDAFHSLLHGGETIKHLITVHGYDMRLCNIERWQHLEATVRRAASDVGVPLAIIRTNLRQHPLSKAISWPRAHGGALAALAHLMRAQGDRLLISSSFSPDCDQPWGTHWDLDHRWSSEAVAVRHFGEQYNRIRKIQAIAHEPVVRRNLHVCLQKHAENAYGNCSRCEKCVRTMVILDQGDALGHFPVFSQRKPLVELIDDVPGIDPAIKVFWHDILAVGIRPELRAAVERMLQRPLPVRRRHSVWTRMTKRLRTALRPRVGS